MRFSGKLVSVGKDYELSRDRITIVSSERLNPQQMQDFFDKPLDIRIDVARKTRGLNANGYAWALLGELQEKLKIPKEDLYREYIRRCGPFEVIPIKNVAVDRFIQSWESNGLGWVCDTTKSKLDGYTNVLAYYGSSSYNTSEMEFLLSSIVEDCISHGIPTKRNEAIESLSKEWR